MSGVDPARLIWSAIAEPHDTHAMALTSVMGHADALEWLRSAQGRAAAAAAGLSVDSTVRQGIANGADRWGLRLAGADPDRILEATARLGARIVVPGEPDWPLAFAGLAACAPHALWVRGALAPEAAWSRSIALVGSRSATAYGERMAGEIAAAAADRGVTVISGGAYGIDAAAHRGALVAGGATVAVLAGGVDRLYPPSNDALLRRMMEHGALVSESPPGFAPHRHRFLSRNRLIAAARATVVVEAAPRSGALNTAGHARQMLRPVGAVPGPVTSIASKGCHTEIRDRGAILVASSDDALALALTAGEVEEQGELPVDASGALRQEFRSDAERRAYGALGSRGAATDAAALTAGLSVAEVLGVLGALELRGAVVRDGARWRRTAAATPRQTQKN